MEWLLSDILLATGGRLLGADRTISGVSTDTRSVAAGQLFVALRGEREGHTLQTTALVNEACLRLLGQRNVDPGNRAQFAALAAETTPAIKSHNMRVV